ncbi:MAG: glycoside hydrolase family 3 C-terminal domain-containing protein [Novosphingobium sp.]|nr:glycoside hydrolase family 3 C-terminal domain-containing protein [Novosphingobium sp.]
MNLHRTGSAIALVFVALGSPLLAQSQDPAARAAATEAAMTDEERVVITNGVMPLPFLPGVKVPEGAVPGAGFVPGIPRLGIPNLTETDASLGVSYVMGLRGPEGATALPSGTAMGSTWNVELMRRGGAMIGSEARAKGFNVLLAGGVNLMRDPRNGRTFEYLGEDPLHSGLLGGAAIAGIQSNHIISTVKHFALNGQETARNFVNSKITDANARESDLLAFKIAIERGQPGSVMCAYNRVNDAQACGNDYLLNQVLKRDWGYKGFVMSDWGAVHGLDFALKGLDQQSGAQLDPKVFFGKDLLEAAARDPAYRERMRDMNRRILYAIYAANLDKHPVSPGGAIDRKANADIAEEVARQGIVLLRNRGNALPLAATVKRIAVIGGYADTGVLSGAGSSQVHGDGGAAATVSLGGTGPFAALISEQYHRSTPPLDAIKARARDAKVTFRTGAYITDAVASASKADVAIVFANQWQTEGLDQPDLSLPRGQDALIAAVAAANPNTIVVLQTGSAVAMPWLEQTAAVVEAWYPGVRGGEAIAAVLFGETNPSGRLPITFPASIADLPRPKLDGSDTIEPDFQGRAGAELGLEADYDIEGSDLGYRWNARTGRKALFPFGHGLSYTSFESSGLKVAGMKASFTVTNTGQREGATVAQLYMVATPGGPQQRLAGFRKVSLKPGESRKVALEIEPRIVAEWENGGWSIAGGEYRFALGDDAENLGQPVTVKLPARRWAK